MTSTADDSHSPPPADVHHSPESLNDDENDEETGSTDQDNNNVLEDHDESAALQNNARSNLQRRRNSDSAVTGGETDETNATTEEESREEVQSSPDQSQRRVGENRYEEIYDFPPDFSSLNINGRTRFDLVSVRGNGRLQIFKVPNRWPQLVRSPVRDGRLRIWQLDDDQRGGEQRSPPHGGQSDRRVD